MRTALALSVVALAFGPGPTRCLAQELQVDLDSERSVRFISRASIEEFEGVTDRIDGYVLLDGPELSTSTEGEDTELYLEVDLASLDTGIGLRNRHMRDNYLEVEEYPFASFQGHILRTESQTGGGFRVSAAGTMSIHGVDREMEIACEVVTAVSGYRVRCTFPILLTDFDIEIPKVMFLKLSNEIRLELDFGLTVAGNQR